MKKLIESDTISPEGYRTVVVFNHKTGSRCGYIFLPKDDKAYVEPIYKDVEFGEKTITMMEYNEMYDIEVYGGLTYCSVAEDGDTYPVIEEREGQWLGFDTAHCYDAADYEVWRTLIESDEDKNLIDTLQDIHDRCFTPADGDPSWRITIKDVAFLEKECEDMSKQIKTMTRGQLENQDD